MALLLKYKQGIKYASGITDGKKICCTRSHTVKHVLCAMVNYRSVTNSNSFRKPIMRTQMYIMTCGITTQTWFMGIFPE